MESIKDLIGGQEGLQESCLSDVSQLLAGCFANATQLLDVSMDTLKEVQDGKNKPLLSLGERNTIVRKAKREGNRYSACLRLKLPAWLSTLPFPSRCSPSCSHQDACRSSACFWLKLPCPLPLPPSLPDMHRLRLPHSTLQALRLPLFAFFQAFYTSAT